MPKVDELVGALEAETPLAAEGAFTLDREQARRKVRHFQLPDPRMYVLSIVQLASVLGAETVDFVELDSDDTAVEFGGVSLQREDVEELYASLLGGPDASPARQELAIAVNGAMALDPKFVRITSCRERDGERRMLELVCRPNEPDVIEESDALPTYPLGTRIHVKEKFGAGLLRFLDALLGELAESVHLRERCQWARIAVNARGETMSGHLLGVDLLHRSEIERNDVRVVTGFVGASRARLRMLCHGVWLEERDFDGPPGFHVFCDGTRFRKNVSRTGVVHDEVFDAAMQVVELARQQTFVALAAEMREHGSAKVVQAREVVLGEIDRALQRNATLDDAAPPWLRALAELPLWPSVVERARATTWELARDPDGAGHVSEPFHGLDDVWRTTVLLDDADRALFNRLFRRRIDRTRELHERVAWVEQREDTEALRSEDRRRWRQRPHAAVLPDGAWLIRRTVKRHGIAGEVGITGGDAVQGRIHLVKDGCLLCSVDWPEGLPATHAVLEAEFEPTPSYDGALPDETLARAVGGMLFAARKAWRTLAKRNVVANEPIAGLLLAYLAVGERTTVSFRAYHAVGFEGERARELVRDEAMLPAWRVGADKQHAIASCRLFRTLTGEVATLADLHAQLQQAGQIAIVRASKVAYDLRVETFAVVAAPAELAALSAVFGPRAIIDRSDLVRDAVREHGKAVSADALRHALCVRPDAPVVEFAVDELAGALVFDGIADDGPATISLLQRGELLEQIQESLPVRDAVAAVEVSGVPLERDASGIGARARARVVAAVEHGIGLAIADTARRVAAGEAELSPIDAARVLAALRSRLQSVVWLRAHASLRAADPARADAAYVELARLGHGTYWDVLASQIAEEIGRGRVPAPDRIAKALRIRARVDAPCIGLLGQLVEAMPAIGELPLYRNCAGAPIGLAAIVAAARRGRIGVVSERELDRAYDDSEGLVVVAEGLAVEVLRVCRDLQVTRGSRLFVARERRRISDSREQRAEIAIADGDAVVSTRVERGACRGELGLALPHAGRSTVELCVQRRSVGFVHPDLPVPMVGVLDHDALDLDFAFAEDGIGEAHWRDVEQRCRDALPELLHALARHSDAATLAAIARRVLLDPRLELADDLRAVFDALPAFAGLGGRLWSRAELVAAARECGEIDVVPPQWTGDAGDGVVITARAAELRDIRRVIGRTRDYRQVAEARARRARAPEVTPMPVDALGRMEVDTPGLRGSLWVDASGGLVELVADGRVAGRVLASSWWAVRGFVEGDAVGVAADWSGATLDAPARATVEAVARSAFESVVAKFEALLRGEREALPRPAHARAALAHALTRAGRAKPIAEADAALWERVSALPLFERPSGTAVSLDEARRDGVEPDPNPTPNPTPNPIPAPAPDSVPPPNPDSIPVPDPAPVPQPDPDPAPDPVPITEPDPPPPPIEIAPALARVVEAVRDQLRSVFEASSGDPAHAHLHRITAANRDLALVSDADASRVFLNARHPVFESAAAGDYAALCLLASSAYTTLNRLREDVTDDDEARFHDAHAIRILASVAGRESAGAALHRDG